MAEGNTRFCPICGASLSSDDRVCNTCGSEIDVERPPIEPPRSPPNRIYIPWIFFGLGFALGVFAMEEFLPSSSIFLGIDSFS